MQTIPNHILLTIIIPYSRQSRGGWRYVIVLGLENRTLISLIHGTFSFSVPCFFLYNCKIEWLSIQWCILISVFMHILFIDVWHTQTNCHNLNLYFLPHTVWFSRSSQTKSSPIHFNRENSFSSIFMSYQDKSQLLLTRKMRCQYYTKDLIQTLQTVPGYALPLWDL